ncbi:hypothetical protein [Streptomyces sp. NPDC046909]|uniref:hypothetical protein n=1 Tax=Streptomyces sp. NPDC046909 TaxID=3155617 RepID=UPI0034117067
MERTHHDPTDEALKQLIEQPSYGAQVLVVTARMLEMDSAEPMTVLARERALDIAADAILGRLPDAVSEDSLARAYRMLPAIGRTTRGEYALHLRAAAKELG